MKCYLDKLFQNGRASLSFILHTREKDKNTKSYEYRNNTPVNILKVFIDIIVTSQNGMGNIWVRPIP